MWLDLGARTPYNISSPRYTQYTHGIHMVYTSIPAPNYCAACIVRVKITVFGNSGSGYPGHKSSHISATERLKSSGIIIINSKGCPSKTAIDHAPT